MWGWGRGWVWGWELGFGVRIEHIRGNQYAKDTATQYSHLAGQ